MSKGNFFPTPSNSNICRNDSYGSNVTSGSTIHDGALMGYKSIRYDDMDIIQIVTNKYLSECCRPTCQDIDDYLLYKGIRLHPKVLPKSLGGTRVQVEPRKYFPYVDIIVDKYNLLHIDVFRSYYGSNVDSIDTSKNILLKDIQFLCQEFNIMK